VIVASDVIYEEQNVEPLIECLEAVWEASTAAAVQVHCLIALKNRDLATNTLDDFFRKLEQKGFQHTEVRWYEYGMGRNFGWIRGSVLAVKVNVGYLSSATWVTLVVLQRRTCKLFALDAYTDLFAVFPMVIILYAR
jgi:hypothetical protein